MRRHRLLTAGVSVALLLAAGSPALAAPGNGKAKGHDKGVAKDHENKPAKPAKPAPAPKPKKSKAGVSGGGSVATPSAEFSIQARSARLDKSHFNYTSTDGSYKLRCRGLAYEAVSANVARVTDTNCALTTGTGTARKTETVPVSATFTDNGEPAEGQTTAGPDSLTLFVNDMTTPVVANAAINGNVKIRP